MVLRRNKYFQRIVLHYCIQFKKPLESSGMLVYQYVMLHLLFLLVNKLHIYSKWTISTVWMNSIESGFYLFPFTYMGLWGWKWLHNEHAYLGSTQYLMKDMNRIKETTRLQTIHWCKKIMEFRSIITKHIVLWDWHARLSLNGVLT